MLKSQPASDSQEKSSFWTIAINVIFIVAGIIFLIIALISLLNTVLGFRLNGEIIWLNLLYAAINSLAAYGLLARQKWVVLAFGINWLGTLILFQLQSPSEARVLFNTISLSNLMIILSSALFLSAYALRRHLSEKYISMPFGIFIALWLISFSVNILGL